MVALALRFLTGCSVSSSPTDRERPEWPPHPDRVFMALASAYFETQGDSDERGALLWLERQGPPEIRASEHTKRAIITSFVPVNDTTMPKTRANEALTPQQGEMGIRILPEFRGRQPRQFPVAIPQDPTVYFIWQSDTPADVLHGLESLCNKLIRVGHSSSLVQAWIPDSCVIPNLVPTEGMARMALRVPGIGRLQHLEDCYGKQQRPERSRWAGYERPSDPVQTDVPHSVFDARLLVLRHVPRAHDKLLGLEGTLTLTEGLHDAVVKLCPEPVPEWVSGHEADGHPSQNPHLAFLTLPFVGAKHADGRLLGVGLAIPRTVPLGEVARCLNPVFGYNSDGSFRNLHLYKGTVFDWVLELERSGNPPVSLRDWTWTRPARRWATVTPIAFDRHPKGDHMDEQLEEMVGEACERIGLPTPRDVLMSQLALHEGTPHSRGFRPMRRKSGNGNLRHSHAVITFNEPVRGPIILGAGRYRGYGLCRPVRGQEEEEW